MGKNEQSQNGASGEKRTAAKKHLKETNRRTEIQRAQRVKEIEVGEKNHPLEQVFEEPFKKSFQGKTERGSVIQRRGINRPRAI